MIPQAAQNQAETLQSLVKRRAKPMERTSKIITVCSGKGGVGKTVVSVNLALRLASIGLRTLLIDLDPGLANVDVHMRLAGRHDVDDILEGACRPADALLVADRGLLVVPGGRATEAERERLLAIRDRSGPKTLVDRVLQSMPAIDVVVLDTGAGVGPWVQGAIEVAHRTVVVTQSDPASVTDAYGVIKVAHAIRDDIEPSLLVNRVTDKDEAILTATRVRKVASTFLGFRPELLGWFHEHQAIASSVRTQVPFSLRLDEQHPSQRELAVISAKLADSMRLVTTASRARSGEMSH
ncbi:MAG: AAA family ATPase [Planctomycetes bacterium]|nr:AAA family ATPase [Planctomycetota bacterium]